MMLILIKPIKIKRDKFQNKNKNQIKKKEKKITVKRLEVEEDVKE